jgi:phosphatidylserine decarboxylase
LSRSLGRLADTPLPRSLRQPVLGLLASSFRIDLGEAERPLREYRSFNDLFVRRLKPGLRHWPRSDTVAGSPVDGIVGQVGTLGGGQAVQAKGRSYSVAQLLGSEAEAERFERGLFVTLYLSPRHYHRIHAPTGGAIPAARYVPGALLPVNDAAVKHVEGLFARNERLLCHLDGPLGRIAVVAVGAYNVGRISAAFDPDWNGPDGSWVTNRRRRPPLERRYDPPRRVEQGDEIMAFHLGSTVVLLFEKGRAHPDPACEPGREVRLGDAIVGEPS